MGGLLAGCASGPPGPPATDVGGATSPVVHGAATAVVRRATTPVVDSTSVPVVPAAAAAGVPGAAEDASAPRLERFTFEEPHMGTVFRVVLYTADRRAAAAHARAAFARVARLDSLLSDYRPDSELSRLSETAGSYGVRRVSPETAEVLALARSWAERTGGAFDPTVGPLSRLWRWSARRGELPAAARLAEARAVVGWRGLAVDAEANEVALERAGMSLDLGGIAKGYAADRALAALVARGVESALVDAGGDLALGAAPAGERGWRVEAPDGHVFELEHAGVATSGDVHRVLVVDGVRYAHVVDPRTGLGVTDAPTVTVVAPDATTADVLASAMIVLDAAAGAALAREIGNVAVRVGGPRPWATPSFPGPHARPTSGGRP